MGHSREVDMTDVYDKLPEDSPGGVWRWMKGSGLVLLSRVVPNVPRKQKRQPSWLPSKFLKAQEKLVAGGRFELTTFGL